MRTAFIVFLIVAVTSSLALAQPGGGSRGRRDHGITLGDVLKVAAVAVLANQAAKQQRRAAAAAAPRPEPPARFSTPLRVQIVRGQGGSCGENDLLDMAHALRLRGAEVVEPAYGGQQQLVAPYIVELSTSYERGSSFSSDYYGRRESERSQSDELLGRAQVMLYRITGQAKLLVASADALGTDSGYCRDLRQDHWYGSSSSSAQRPESRARAIASAVQGAADALARQANETLPRYDARSGASLAAPQGYCPACGKPRQDGANFCPYCGAKLAE